MISREEEFTNAHFAEQKNIYFSSFLFLKYPACKSGGVLQPTLFKMIEQFKISKPCILFNHSFSRTQNRKLYCVNIIVSYIWCMTIKLFHLVLQLFLQLLLRRSLTKDQIAMVIKFNYRTGSNLSMSHSQ